MSLHFRFTYNKEAADCAGAIFHAMMKHALEMPHGSAGECSLLLFLFYSYFPIKGQPSSSLHTVRVLRKGIY